MNLTLNVNRQNYSVSVNDGGMPLLWVLRDLIGLTGTKNGRGIEVCGAFPVLADGQTSAVGKNIATIGTRSTNRSHPVLQAWIAGQDHERFIRSSENLTPLSRHGGPALRRMAPPFDGQVHGC